MPPPARAVSTAGLTDAELGAEALRGDRGAFAELFGRHESGLVNVAYRMTGSREDAADIAQEAFLRVFARLPQLAGRDVDLAAYLHRTARNLVYDRSAGRARETPVASIEVTVGSDRDPTSDPELTALLGAQGEEVRAANARLAERHRLALALRELEGMGYAEIGRVLDLTPGAVGQLLARARMALRRELRLEQVDAGALEPGCRARLGDIAALVDGELDPDRAHVLSRHMEGCAACRASRDAFEDAGRRYRAWLPLPLLLGLGADTARAAEARGLVRLDGPATAAGGAGRLAGLRGQGGPPRTAGLVGAAAAGLALIVAVPVLVASRSGSDGGDPAVAPAAVATAGSTTVATTATVPPSPTATTAAIPTTAGATSPVVAGAPPPPAARGGTAPGATTTRSPSGSTRGVTTPAPARTRPPAAPTVTAAGAPPAAPTTTGPATSAPPAPAGDAPPTRRDPPAADPPPPATTAPTTPTVPTTPTRTEPPDIPFPTTFTGSQPPPVNP